MRTWTRKELKEKAKCRLKANYWKSVLVGMLTLLIVGSAAGVSGVTSGTSSSASSEMAGSTFMGGITQIPMAGKIAIVLFVFAFVLIAMVIAVALQVLVCNPLEIGCNRFFYKNLEENVEVKEVCYAFDRGYKNSVKVMFFRGLYSILWTLLFIIPGIVKVYEYSMIPYILSENPNMDKKEVFALSKQMMSGNKWKAFVLDLSFILWDILGACTFGILNIFYIEPYKRLTNAGLYQALKEEQLEKREQKIIEDMIDGQ